MAIYMGMHLNIDALKITPEILSLIAELDEFKGAWSALETPGPERLSALRHIATIERFGSSTRIEGVKVSDSENSDSENSGVKRKLRGQVFDLRFYIFLT